MKVSPRYQIVIPKAVRDALGIKAGTEVDIITKGNIACIVPVLSYEVLQKQLQGKLTTKGLREKKERKL